MPRVISNFEVIKICGQSASEVNQLLVKNEVR